MHIPDTLSSLQFLWLITNLVSVWAFEILYSATTRPSSIYDTMHPRAILGRLSTNRYLQIKT